jgi:hypothetical protein
LAILISPPLQVAENNYVVRYFYDPLNKKKPFHSLQGKIKKWAEAERELEAECSKGEVGTGTSIPIVQVPAVPAKPVAVIQLSSNKRAKQQATSTANGRGALGSKQASAKSKSDATAPAQADRYLRSRAKRYQPISERIGDKYQAEVPAAILVDPPESLDGAELIWSAHPSVAVSSFLNEAQQAMLPQGELIIFADETNQLNAAKVLSSHAGGSGDAAKVIVDAMALRGPACSVDSRRIVGAYSEEEALNCLHTAGFDQRKALDLLRRHSAARKPTSLGKVEETFWTSAEEDILATALASGNLDIVKNRLPNKSFEKIVERYYLMLHRPRLGTKGLRRKCFTCETATDDLSYSIKCLGCRHSICNSCNATAHLTGINYAEIGQWASVNGALVWACPECCSLGAADMEESKDEDRDGGEMKEEEGAEKCADAWKGGNEEDMLLASLDMLASDMSKRKAANNQRKGKRKASMGKSSTKSNRAAKRPTPVVTPAVASASMVYAEVTCCELCGHHDNEDRMLLCGDGLSHGCNLGFHVYCLDPPRDTIPQGDWFCETCKLQLRRPARTAASALSLATRSSRVLVAGSSSSSASSLLSPPEHRHSLLGLWIEHGGYKGQVVKVRTDDHDHQEWFVVEYDDGDREEFTRLKLLSMLVNTDDDVQVAEQSAAQKKKGKKRGKPATSGFEYFCKTSFPGWMVSHIC